MDIRSAGSRLAAGVSAGRRAEAVIALTDADGITSLSPDSGTSRISVAILGTFPAGDEPCCSRRPGAAPRRRR